RRARKPAERRQGDRRRAQHRLSTLLLPGRQAVCPGSGLPAPILVAMREAELNAVPARPPDRPSIAAGRIGVLIVNLGTADATDYWSMRRYLKEFLRDRRVIEENRIKWWLILNLIVLTVRPRRRGRDYESIWNRERNESPLKTITRSQAEKLSETLAARDR